MTSSGQRQQPMEHRRHHVRVRDAVLVDERSVSSASQPSISTIGTPIAAGAASENASGAAWYSGPVQRWTCCRAVVARSASRAERSRAPRCCAARPSAGRSCPTCRASSRRGPDRRAAPGSSRGERVVVRLEPVDRRRRPRASPSASARGRRRRSRGIGEARVGDERGRLAVVDDVARFLTGEVPVDRRQPEAGPLRGRPWSRRTRAGSSRTARLRRRRALPVLRNARASWLAWASTSASVRSPCPERNATRSGNCSAQYDHSVPRSAAAFSASTSSAAGARMCSSVTRLILGDPSQLRPGRRTPRRCRPSPRTGSRRSR